MFCRLSLLSDHTPVSSASTLFTTIRQAHGVCFNCGQWDLDDHFDGRLAVKFGLRVARSNIEDL
jgi:hypothetical protein